MPTEGGRSFLSSQSLFLFLFLLPLQNVRDVRIKARLLESRTSSQQNR
jgi:hypothetical protein